MSKRRWQGRSRDRRGQEPAEQGDRRRKPGESWVRVAGGESISQRRLPLRERAAKFTPSSRAVRIASCPPSSLPSWLRSMEQAAEHNCGGIPATHVGGGRHEQVIEGRWGGAPVSAPAAWGFEGGAELRNETCAFDGQDSLQGPFRTW